MSRFRAFMNNLDDLEAHHLTFHSTHEATFKMYHPFEDGDDLIEVDFSGMIDKSGKPDGMG